MHFVVLVLCCLKSTEPKKDTDISQLSSQEQRRLRQHVQFKKNMSCFGRAAVPVKRVWLGLSSRLHLRRTTGLRKLRKDVRTCEYSDVQVMWEMLRKPERRGGAAGKKKAAWSRLFSYCCAF